MTHWISSNVRRGTCYGRLPKSRSRLPDFHHEVGGIFLVRQTGRANLRDAGRRRFGDRRVVLNAQAHASPLRQRQRLKWPERPLAENGIDLADHHFILSWSDRSGDDTPLVSGCFPLDPHYKDSAEASELKTKKAELRKALMVINK